MAVFLNVLLPLERLGIEVGEFHRWEVVHFQPGSRIQHSCQTVVRDVHLTHPVNSIKAKRD